MTEIYRDTDNKVPYYQKSYVLTGESFTLRLNYNKHDDSWYMTIYGADGSVVLSSLRLVTLIYILRNKRAHAGIPAGDFKVEQTTNDMSKTITYDSFGSEFKLYYYEPDEVVY